MHPSSANHVYQLKTHTHTPVFQTSYFRVISTLLLVDKKIRNQKTKPNPNRNYPNRTESDFLKYPNGF